MDSSGRTRLLLVVMLLGCGTSVRETFINDPPRTMTAKAPHAVLIYASNPPTRPHMTLARLEVEERRGISHEGVDLAIDRLRTRAAKLGCDAVVVSGIRERDAISATASPGAAYRLLDPGATVLRGKCIVFARQPASAGGECPCRARAAPSSRLPPSAAASP